MDRSLAGVFDIEEIVEYGKENVACPFYLARELQKTAEVILMPYNYIIDPAVRKSLGISLEKAVIIIDEAHNLV
jgi:Rad3-related DNA helicase